jgi:hypothetical protein
MMRQGNLCIRLAIFIFTASTPIGSADELAALCKHDYYENVRQSQNLSDGSSVYYDIDRNVTHQYHYENRNVTVSPYEAATAVRTLIINLEPCKGVVYLFVRKTRRCHPDPYSCIIGQGLESRSAQCAWTHFMSEIDGSRDGAPTVFEVPMSCTNWYISVFATEKSAYTLTVLGDTKTISPGAHPHPGNQGRIAASQTRELQVDLQWDEATYSPAGSVGGQTKYYVIYSSLLLEKDNRTNMAVFLNPAKIMNTVCGLRNNTDRYYQRFSPESICVDGKCNATVDGVITDRQYVFNVVAQSELNQFMAYSGIIVKTDWEVVRKAASDQTLKVVGVVSGSVLAMVVIIYVMMLKLYGG